MVPSIVVHCINEVELRGMNEQGLYRVNGAKVDVKCLLEKFLKGKGAPNLSNVDITTICSTLKDFLRYVTRNIFYKGDAIYTYIYLNSYFIETYVNR